MAKYSKKAESYISHKMEKMKNEDKPQKQKVAIAMSMARQKGMKVPKKKDPPGDPPGVRDSGSDTNEHQPTKQGSPQMHDDGMNHNMFGYDTYKRRGDCE